MYKVDPWNNFCRVFELPNKFPEGFCFGGGKQVIFTMVDWFNPVCGIPQAGVSKEVFEIKVGPIKDETKEVDEKELEEQLIPFLKEKHYVQSNKTYLVICDFGFTFTFTK